MKKILLILLLITNLSITCNAWIYPEHRDITLLAILKLDSARRALLNQLWAAARTGYESRLDTSVADVNQGEHPKYIDYAAFPAISGDHSTSAEDLLNNILKTEWILSVADIAAWLKAGIANSKDKSEIAGYLRDSDLRLLRVDPDYVSRAGSNNVHFILQQVLILIPVLKKDPNPTA